MCHIASLKELINRTLLEAPPLFSSTILSIFFYCFIFFTSTTERLTYIAATMVVLG